jgi:hypothetical protein
MRAAEERGMAGPHGKWLFLSSTLLHRFQNSCAVYDARSRVVLLYAVPSRS